MKDSKYSKVLLVSLISMYCLTSQPLSAGGSFKPVLIRVEVNWDQLQPDEALILTCWWQNAGTKPSEKPLSGFLELSFGHQRIVETTPRYFRHYWEPYPSTNLWKSGEVWKTTARYNLKMGWGGSYKIAVGLCDEDHQPVEITGEDGTLVKQVQIGQIEFGWSLGTPTLEMMRKPWTKELNKLQLVTNTKQSGKSTFLTIGKETEIKLSDRQPIIAGIRSVENSRFSSDMQPLVTIRELAADRLIYSTETGVKIDYQITKTGDLDVVYHGVVEKDNLRLAEFNLKFESAGRQLQILLSDIKEQKGYELLEIKLPSLLCLGGDEVSMVSFFGGGRLITLKESAPEGYTFNYDTRNAAALITGNDQIVLESTCLDDRLIEAVYENDKIRTANLGMVLVNRIRGKGNVSSVSVESDHKITIELLDESWGEPGWQSVAKYLRRELVGKNRGLYKRALVYKILATSGPEPPEGRVSEESPYSLKRLTYIHTFKEISEQVRRMSNILDGMPQVLYIAGFQEGGFDNSYPFVFNTDQRIGTIEDLKKCIADGKDYNAIVGLHDNYDDMPLTKYYNPGIVSHDENGEPWMGWIWPAGLSHIISPYKYVQTGLMQERVKKTIELYGLNKSHHIDVLSSEPLRYDFDPACPASADKSHKGKLAIIDEFNRYGIDITSESLTHPFVGHISYALWPREDRNSSLFTGDQYIPLVPFVYHGTIGYCGSPGNDRELLWSLVRGNKYFPNEDGVTDKDITAIYIQHIPLDMFYDKKMEKIEKDGETTKVVYDDKSYIEVIFTEKTYEIVCDGELIGKDWTTFVPGFKEGSYLAFSRNGGKLDYPLPSIFGETKKLHAITLTSEGEGNELPCHVVDGRVILDMPQGVPVRITNKP